MSKKTISVRVDEEMHKKLRCVAEHEERSISNEVVSLIRKKIEWYESVYGVTDVGAEIEGDPTKALTSDF